MQKAPIGTRVKPLGIQRVSCAEGSKCRCVLIDPNPQFKYIAYDEERKCKVEVNQDLLIRYGMRASTTFFYLVAKLNTDLNGTVHGDQFTVEYLQLSENLNNQFSDSIDEMGTFTSISLEKIKKSANGKDFSYTQAKPSNKFDPATIPSLHKKLQELQQNKEFIAQCWSLIDATTSITAEAYEKRLLEEKNGHGSQAQAALTPSQAPQNALPSASVSAMPQAPQSAIPQGNDFGDGFDDNNSFGGDDW